MNPTLFETQYFTINTFWIFFLVAVIISTIVLVKIAVREGLKVQFLSDNSGILILWTIVGARIFGLIENYDIYFYQITKDTFLSIFYIWDKGLNLWGGIISFFICFYFICKKQDQNYWKWFDVFIPAIILGIGIGSIGAFFEGINYGRETSLPWGVNFESPAIKYTVPIHPTQIYAFLYSIVLSISLSFATTIKKVKNMYFPGLIGIGGFTIYGLLKFLEEFLRGDDVWTIFDIRVPQILYAIMTILAGTFLYIRYNRHTKVINNQNHVRS
ncbi:MAG: prolipoprotein diacylglyceryl transferase family protein [Candidatus Gracilibacteria bacterium]|jgi:phosphatidylglycerol:prolipoprotein diacylglycerol transferase